MFSGLRKTISLALPKDRYFKLGLLVSVFQGASAVALLGVSAWLISRAAEMPSIVYLSLAVVGVRGFAIGRATFRYAERLLLHESAFRMLGELRPKLFKALVPFIPAGMSAQGRGETISKVVTDVDELQNLPLRVVAPVIQAASVGLASVIFLGFLFPPLALALATTLIAAFLIAMPISSKLAKNADLAVSPLKAQLANQSLELLEHQDVLIAYGWLPARLEKLEKIDADLHKASSNSSVSNGAGLALFSGLSTISVLAGSWLGSLSVVAGANPGVQLAVFALLPMAIFEVVQNAQPAMSALNKFRTSADRVLDLLNREIPVELSIANGVSELDHFDSLEFSNFGVRYPENKTETISNFNLKMNRGSRVFLGGDSGSGKSTVGLALVRLIEHSSGTYLINGSPVEEFKTESIHRLMGYVEQEPTIFIGDLRSNLIFAKPEASDSELIDVLVSVGLWDMFETREGLNTGLGDRGVLISGGEAQRLALARALLADFQVLVLDEPTANVDERQADSLVSDLLSISTADSKRAVLLISHDERFAELCDQAIRL